MPKSEFTFGSFSSAAFPWFYKTGPINFPTPEKDTVSYEVPGRSGDLLIDFGSYKNVELECEVVIEAGTGQTFLEYYDYLRSAIMVQSGYQRLEDSLYPDEYRMARVVSVEMGKSDTKGGTAVITFDAKPQRYLTSGEESVRLDGTARGFQTVGVGNEIFSDRVKTYHANLNDIDLNDIFEVVKVTDYFPVIGRYMTFFLPDSYRPTGNDGFIRATHTDGGNPQTILADPPYAADITSYGYRYNHPVRTFSGKKVIQTGNFPNLDEAAIEGRLRWVVSDSPYGGDLDEEATIYASNAPDKTVLTPPPFAIGCSPLIHIFLNSSVEFPIDETVVYLNEDSITLQIPEGYVLARDGGAFVYLTDLYVDCETMSCYAVARFPYLANAEPVIYNVNKIVALEGEFKYTADEPLRVYTNSIIDHIEIVPRWWKI